ncbi:MAG: hypothetical protein HYU02_04260 [Thaumarchaeota archaeon]|nr:hypothetical protein [Nitrososphaerota archaeon]
MSIAELISKAEGNSKWLSANYRQLVKKYNDEWVAVLDKDVIDYDKDLKRLSARLRKKLDERYSEVAFDYVTKEPIDMILVV